jgi:hypothetical protein
VFRDSRGVVHTVSSPDPLEDLPDEAASALASALLVPTHGDLGGALERCEAVRMLLDRWQDAFFAALPIEIDLEEESEWATRAGVSLEEIEAEWEDEDDSWDEEDDAEEEETPGQLGIDEIDLSELTPLEDEPLGLLHLEPVEEVQVLGEPLVAELERSLLLLPLRVRLEALVAAGALVDSWAELYADHEKCLGHLVLRHGAAPEIHLHEVLADEHARLHAARPQHGHPG